MAIANTAGATLNLNGFAQTVAACRAAGANGGAVTLGAGTLDISPRNNQAHHHGTAGARTREDCGAGGHLRGTTINRDVQLGCGRHVGVLGGAIANSGVFVIDRTIADPGNVISEQDAAPGWRGHDATARAHTGRRRAGGALRSEMGTTACRSQPIVNADADLTAATRSRSRTRSGSGGVTSRRRKVETEATATRGLTDSRDAVVV